MNSKRSRRTFLKDCSTGAAALATAGLGTAADAGAEEEARLGTPHLRVTCGSRFAGSEKPPASCPIRDDERQYVPPEGQRWTTPEALRSTHGNLIKPEEPSLLDGPAEPSASLSLWERGGRKQNCCLSAGDQATPCFLNQSWSRAQPSSAGFWR